MDIPDFPQDLVAAERERQDAWRRLSAIPLRPYTDGAGSGHRTSTGWTPEHEPVEEALNRRLQELSALTATHPYWQTFEGEKRVAARMRLKQAVAAPATPAE